MITAAEIQSAVSVRGEMSNLVASEIANSINRFEEENSIEPVHWWTFPYSETEIAIACKASNGKTFGIAGEYVPS